MKATVSVRLLAPLVAILTLVSACKKKSTTGPTDLVPDTEFKTAPVPSKETPPEQAFVQYLRTFGPELLNPSFVPTAIRMAWWEYKNSSKSYREKVCYFTEEYPWVVWNPVTQIMSCRKFEEDKEGEIVPYPIDTKVKIWVTDSAFSPVRRGDRFIINGTLLTAAPIVDANGVSTEFMLDASFKPYW
jgi:hypothetical protein